jgi:hypothetical protein
MNSDPAVLRPRARTIVLLTKIKSTARLGATTLAFFRKGDDLEATEFENLPHDDPSLVPPKLGFRNFDRVPRRRAPLVIAFLVVVAAGLSMLGWHRIPEVRGTTAPVAAALGAKLSGAWVQLKGFVTPGRTAR